MLHLALTAHTQRVVPGEVGAPTHQEQPGLGRGQQVLRLLPADLPVEPSRTGGRGGRQVVTERMLINMHA